MKRVLFLGVLFFLFACTGPSALAQGIWGKASNLSSSTTCAEEDNVNIPLYADFLTSYRVVAMHPGYEFTEDDCSPDFSGCDSAKTASIASENCGKLYDDGFNVVDSCVSSDWWRPYQMRVEAGAASAEAHLLRVYQKVADEDSWPQFMVLYQDGNMRLIPHPQPGRQSVCFGSSVIIGHAAGGQRPYIDIEKAVVSFDPLKLSITYRDGQTATIYLIVDRTKAVALVRPAVSQYSDKPFAVFRSMWVEDGNCDVDQILGIFGQSPILADWGEMLSAGWLFRRANWSKHNISAPDIYIDFQSLNN